MAWRIQEARQRFSEMVERARADGPQVVTKHGRDAVVVGSADELARTENPQRDLLAFIGSGPDLDVLELERAGDHGRQVDV